MKTCKEISRILSLDEELSFMKRAELKMHLLLCKSCSSYATHLQMMREGFQKLFTKLTETDKEQVKKIEDAVINRLTDKKE